MELQEIIEHIKHPEKVLDVPTMEVLIDYCTFWIHNLEEDLMEKDFQVDSKLAKLIEVHGSVAKAEAMLKLEEVYIERKRLDHKLKSIKSYRQNIRRKRDRIIPR